MALASVSRMQWRWKDAEDHFRSAIELALRDPTSPHWLTGLALQALSRQDSAVIAFTMAMRLGNTPDARPALIRTYRALGRTEDADTMYASLVKTYRSSQGVGRDMAVGAVAVGDLKAALDAIRQTIEQRDPIITTEDTEVTENYLTWYL